MSSLEAVPPPWEREAQPSDLVSFSLPPLREEVPDPVAEAETSREAEEYARGYREGLAEGAAQALEQLKPVQQRFVALIEALGRGRANFLHGLERNLHALAIAVAHQLFLEEVQQHPELVTRLVRRAVALLPPGGTIEIRAHPEDIGLLGTHVDMTEPDGRPLAVHWIADDTLERGSFTLENPERLVDGRADVALRSLYERLEHD
jgi:flagellar biosynthesis/type III secretory pathway protein FliH